MTQLPQSTAIQKDTVLQADTEQWYEYPVRAQPHHTDYAGVVWHGAYLTWMESARVECLRELGIDFAELVTLGCNLPVVDLHIRYHRPVQLGMMAVVKTRLIQSSKIRMVWDYRIVSPDGKELYTTAQVTLVAIDMEKGSVMRQLPPGMEDAIAKFATASPQN